MLAPLGGLLPSDSPQKWKTMKEAALAGDASTNRLIKLMLADRVPLLLACAAVCVAVTVLVVLR
jgi:hypothetical protein